MTTLVFEGEELFQIEGTLSEVQHARTTVNLLAQIEKHVTAMSLASGLAAAAGGMHGMLANSAMIALYDGEDTFNFAGLLGTQVVCGTFEGADTFRDGDHIKAVVSKRGEVLYAHAVMRENDKMLFMPLTTLAGKSAHFRYCMRSAWRACIFAWVFLGLAVGYFLTDGSRTLSLEAIIFVISFFFIVPPLLTFSMELWTYRSTRYLGERASALFKVLGFPKPDHLDLTDFIHVYMPGDTYGARRAFNYEKALQQHVKRYG